jgi:gamma-glutamyltranspeptidase
MLENPNTPLTPNKYNYGFKGDAPASCVGLSLNQHLAQHERYLDSSISADEQAYWQLMYRAGNYATIDRKNYIKSRNLTREIFAKVREKKTARMKTITSNGLFQAISQSSDEVK